VQAAIRDSSFDLMILDLRMPGIDGLALLEALRVWGNDIPILMISGYGTVDSAVTALQLGADDFLLKPVEPATLSSRVSELLDRRPRSGNTPTPAGMIGRSPPMRALYDRIARVAPAETTVLITGETGPARNWLPGRFTRSRRVRTIPCSPSIARPLPKDCSRASCSVT
jgi:DNA-binding NtrC family response regulator